MSLPVPASPAPVRRVQRVRHEPKRREVEVVAVDRSSPGFASITFAGESLADFLSASFDDHVKFLFEDGGEQVGRDYTPRRFDAQQRRLTIEFALHGDGRARNWARGAKVGQPVTIGGPRGSMIIPVDYEWHLLVGDATSLPAVHRRLEELPAQSRAMVVLQVDAEDRRTFASPARLELQWVASSESLIAAVDGLTLPPGEGFSWAAGEAADMARVRQLLQHKGQTKEAMRVAAYWKRGASAHHENLE